jgi:hypothetical protein
MGALSGIAFGLCILLAISFLKLKGGKKWQGDVK